MVEINNKENCCGCGSCVQSCPKECISLQCDREGFYYPIVNKDICINCGLCEKVCPLINVAEKREPINVFAAKNHDDSIRMKSSSGGVFYDLAKSIIQQGGYVFGASFNANWNVHHIVIDKIDDIKLLMGSKYVQSNIGNSYRKAKELLQMGCLVLFSGTPCQIAGLHKFLRNKRYDNLLTVDFLCHGVPSPGVWHRYLEECVFYRSRRQAAAGENTVCLSLNLCSEIKDIKFRDKQDGWRKYRLVVSKKSVHKTDKNSVWLSCIHKENPYMKGFLNDIYLRPSCYACKFKRFQSQSDITLADYWGINRVAPQFNDNIGVSMLFINTSKGQTVFNDIKEKFDIIETTFNDTLSNKGLCESVNIHPKRTYFFDEYYKHNMSIEKIIRKCLHIPIYKQIINKLKKHLS